MAPFPSVDILPPLPPAPGEQPVPRYRLRTVAAGQIAIAIGAVALLVSIFIGGWHHVAAIQTKLGDRTLDDSYVGDALTTYTNYYSLSIWAYLEGSLAVPTLAVVCLSVVAGLLAAGARRRVFFALTLAVAIGAFVCIVLDMRALPATIAEMANRFPGFPSEVRMLGQRPGPMMYTAFGALLLQINGALLALIFLPRSRRHRHLRRAQRAAQHQPQPVAQSQPGIASEPAVQYAAMHAPHASDAQWHEGQGAPREQHPG
jgi:hypothetical protein